MFAVWVTDLGRSIAQRDLWGVQLPCIPLRLHLPVMLGRIALGSSTAVACDSGWQRVTDTALPGHAKSEVDVAVWC
jgi:hypothetical protein